MILFGSFDRKTWVQITELNPDDLFLMMSPRYKYYKTVAKKKKGVKY